VHQDQGDSVEQAYDYLLRQPSPIVGGPLDALQLMAELEVETDELLTRAMSGEHVELDDIAGAERRRAFVWVHLAKDLPQFHTRARTAVEAWQRTEARIITAVGAAARSGR